MKQEKLEKKAQELFERQGFKIKREDNVFRALNEGDELNFQVFSSEKYSVEEVREKIEDNIDTVFVDESLREIREIIETDVSVLNEEEDRKSYDLPSFELIGDIAVINDLDGKNENEVVEGITENHPHIETILLKSGQLSGEFRVGEYTKLYGEETETLHKEFGVDMKVDPTKAYYSERFSTERKRVSDQIEPGERVLVMFAGVGPFALIAARHSEAEKIVAVEKNPEACQYLKENIELNSFEERIEAFCGDVEEILPEVGKNFDRVIMPLPGKADEFLELAESVTSGNAVIHYYRFCEEGERDGLEKEIKSLMQGKPEIKSIVKCGERSPSTDRLCVDIEVASCD